MRLLTVAVLVAALAFTLGTTDAIDRPEASVLHMTNELRDAHDLRPLRPGQRLNAAAERHARKMASAGRIFHGTYRFPWDRCWGQNVGVGPTVRSVFRALRRSPSHRHNMLGRCFRRAGIGVAQRGGRVYVVQNFAG